MVSRYLAVLAALLLVQAVPARAQDQSFAAFTAELWTDAQAKAITRATFDTALKGVTPDQRVIAPPPSGSPNTGSRWATMSTRSSQIAASRTPN